MVSASAADAELTESVKEIQAASIRAANLTRQLLTFSRRQPMQTRPLDLDDVVLSVGRMLQRLIGEDIVLHTRLLPGGAWVEGDSRHDRAGVAQTPRSTPATPCLAAANSGSQSTT